MHGIYIYICVYLYLMYSLICISLLKYVLRRPRTCGIMTYVQHPACRVNSGRVLDFADGCIDPEDFLMHKISFWSYFIAAKTLDLFEQRNGIMIGLIWVQLVLTLPGSKFGDQGSLGNLIACVFNHWGPPYPTPSLCFLRYENCQLLSFSTSLNDQSLQKTIIPPTAQVNNYVSQQGALSVAPAETLRTAARMMELAVRSLDNEEFDFNFLKEMGLSDDLCSSPERWNSFPKLRSTST